MTVARLSDIPESLKIHQRGGAAEAGYSGLHYIIYCFIIQYYPHPLHPPPTAPPPVMNTQSRGPAWARGMSSN